jgi:sugar phosphate isomerase/epimerase
VKLGAYTACLHSQPLPGALATLAGMGLDSAEINSGGFLPSPHLPISELRSSETARSEYLGQFRDAGVELTALNCNGNPLHPDPEVREKHAQDVLTSIELGALLGVKRVVTMSGLPASDPGGRLPAWNVIPWDSAYLESLDYQWNEVAIPWWKEVQARAADADVKVCLEMHPHNLVFNGATMQRLATEIDATHVGAEMDPSHLMWQQMDPILVTRELGGLVYNAAAKDVRINEAAKKYGVLDDRFGHVSRDDPNAVGLGGRYVCTAWPQESSWDFVAVGVGHDTAWWAEFLRAIQEIDPDMAVNIEHEDRDYDKVEGLGMAAKVLLDAAKQV